MNDDEAALRCRVSVAYAFPPRLDCAMTLFVFIHIHPFRTCQTTLFHHQETFSISGALTAHLRLWEVNYELLQPAHDITFDH